MDINDWGDADPERDPIRVLQLTTASGSTKRDVEAVLNRAGGQIKLSTEYTSTTDQKAPLKAFRSELRWLLSNCNFEDTDVLFVHRGGGVYTGGRNVNVSEQDSESIKSSLRTIRDKGVEIVLAIGHADTSLFDAREHRRMIGFFEATTPTAGAAWILKEHINSRLVDDEDVYAQP